VCPTCGRSALAAHQISKCVSGVAVLKMDLDLRHLSIMRAVVANELVRKPRKVDDEDGRQHPASGGLRTEHTHLTADNLRRFCASAAIQGTTR